MSPQIKLIIAVVLVILLHCASLSAEAEICIVTKAADTADGICDGDCSLREAVQAKSCSAVTFVRALSGQTLALTGGEIVIDRGLKIVGLGADSLTISGGNASRIFYISDQITSEVMIIAITLTGGNGVGTGSRSGGAISTRGPLSLYNVHVTGNTAVGDLINGGGIDCDSCGYVILLNTTLSNNTATSRGGGINYVSASFESWSSTISGNSAAQGAGISRQGGCCQSRIVNSTIVNNVPGEGGVFTSGASFFELTNSIFAGNTPGLVMGGTMTFSLGNNIFSPLAGTSGVVFAKSDLFDVAPMIGPLQANGGRVPTHPLLPGSVAIDAANRDAGQAWILAVDQRGFGRIVDGDGDGIPSLDIGAAEYLSSTGVSINGHVWDESGRSVRTAQITLTDMQGNSRTVVPNPFGFYRFANVRAGEAYFITVKAKGHTFTSRFLDFIFHDRLEDFTAERND